MSTLSMRLRLVLAVLATSGLGACGGDLGSSPPTATTTSETETGAVFLQLDVYPSEVRDDDSTTIIALPQSHLQTDLLLATNLDVGQLIVRDPLVQAGSVVGDILNPFIAADLPGDMGPIPASVHIRRIGTVQSYATRTDTEGQFSSWIVPAETYDLGIIPDDPMVPMWSQALPIGTSAPDQDIDLGSGVPIYGQVRATTGPVPGARVHVVDERGFVSASAEANDFGLYQVRVQPGTFDVVCEGRGLGQDPVLTQLDVVADADGTKLDFDHPGSLTKVLAEGRVVPEFGPQPVPILVRFTAESLDGYSDGEATWTWETVAGSQGTFLDRVFPGVYTVEYLPPAVEDGPDYSPVRLTGVVIDGQDPLPQVTLTRLVDVEGNVVDDTNQALAGALIDCVEVGFDGRSWFAISDESGLWSLALPEVPVVCTVSPPAERTDLPRTRVEVDPASNLTPTIALTPGSMVTGSVVRDAQPEAFALVEVRSSEGVLLGFSLTDEEGAFTVPVQVPEADVRTTDSTGTP